MDNSVYQNPLCTRYASTQMQEIFSDNHKFSTWRKLWIALLKSQKQMGLIDISDSAISCLENNISNIDYEFVAKKEKEVRHDVMAHVHAFGKICKEAKPLLHLGATSCFVTDNCDVLIMKQGLECIRKKLINVIDKLKKFALKYKDVPTLGFTHLQPAQLTTVGKRATLWIQDLLIDYENICHMLSCLKLRGVKGTTGTQASFLTLFDGDSQKVLQLEKLVCHKMGLDSIYGVTGQTYPRKLDYNILSVLSQVAQSAYKFSNDLRILQNMKELEEPFEKGQIGSSAMAYKRNPMRSERMSSISRFVISLPVNTAITASTQWLERTLDDSANKRIVVAQAFLGADAVLNLYLNICENMVVYEKVIQKHIQEELPFMATEVILMECVKHGGDRQSLHEKIRILSMQAAKRVKEEGLNNNLIDLIKKEKDFSVIKNTIDKLLLPENFTGRASAQVVEFLKNEVECVLHENINILGEVSEINV